MGKSYSKKTKTSYKISLTPKNAEKILISEFQSKNSKNTIIFDISPHSPKVPTIAFKNTSRYNPK